MIILLTLIPTSILKNKTTFQNYIHYDSICLSTINLTDLEQGNAFDSLRQNVRV